MASMGNRPRLLLADDHHMVLDALKLALEDEFDVVGVAATGDEAVVACRALHPDLLLLDLSLPDRSGLEVLTDLRQEMPGLRILVVTMHVERVWADAALQSGALGFVPKDAHIDELKTAIREVLAGRQYLSPLVPEQNLRHFPGDFRLGMAKLTPRQRDIVRKLGDGKSTARIAADLHVTPPTVTFHRVRIRKLLGLKTEWHLMRYALLIRLAEAEAKAAAKNRPA